MKPGCRGNHFAFLGEFCPSESSNMGPYTEGISIIFVFLDPPPLPRALVTYCNLSSFNLLFGDGPPPPTEDVICACSLIRFPFKSCLLLCPYSSRTSIPHPQRISCSSLVLPLPRLLTPVRKRLILVAAAATCSANGVRLKEGGGGLTFPG